MDKFLAIAGHFHPILVHLPVSILLLAAGFEGLSRLNRYTSLRQSVPFILWMGTLFAVLSCITGWLLAQSGDYDTDMQDRHRWLGIATAALSVAACCFPAWRGLLLIAITGFVSFTGYHGLTLTHGEAFLTAPAADQSDKTDEAVDNAVAFVLDQPVSAPPAEIVEKLRKSGVTILPVAQNNHYLAVNFVNVPQPADSLWMWLAALAPQVVILKMSEVQFSATAWQHLEKMAQVTKLYVDATNITDADIGHLMPLQRLQFINLGQTQVTSNGVQQLAALPVLRQIFLFNSKVSRADYPLLQQKMSLVQMDTGGYQMPLLASDTARLKAPK